MSNKHSTLVSLFDDIADSIRAKTGGTSDIVADTFPDSIDEIPTTSEFNNLLQVKIDGFTLNELSTHFTPTCMEYHGGYWWIGGNNSAGVGYIAYSIDLTSWTIVRIHPSRVHPVHALGFDLDNGYVWAFGDTTGYDGRSLIRLNDFFNYPTDSYNYNYVTKACAHTDAVSKDGYTWVMTGTTTTALIKNGGEVDNYYIHGSVSHNLIRCCMYNNFPVAISADGYYTYKSAITTPTVSGEFQIASGLTCFDVAQMGDYLCVVGTKADGTYLYYAKGTLNSLIWRYHKIVSSVVTPIGMVYANGLYMVVYLDANKNIRFWASSTLAGCGTSTIKADILDGYSIKSVSTNGETIALTLDTGSKITTARYKPTL